MDKKQLLEILDADRDKHVAFLQKFLQAPSPNPPGNTKKAADVVCEYLREHGVLYDIVAPQETMPNIVSDCTGAKGNGSRIVMNGHMDVFPVGDSREWKHDPWSGDIQDGFMYGRGAVDMKAGTAASIVAYSYLYKQRKALRGTLALTVVSDEETGGKWGSRTLLENVRWQGDCMINAEPSGVQSVRFGEKGTLRLTFTVRTVGAHGAYLHLSEGANRIGARLVMDLLKLEDIEPTLPPSLVHHMNRPEVRALANEILGNGAADLLLKPTVNIGTWHGGLKVNMIPDKCVFEVDIRLPIGMEAKVMLDKIQKILEAYPEVEMAIQQAASNPASYSHMDHPLFKAIQDNVAEITGTQPMGLPSLGATDCKFWRYLSIPTFQYGVSPKTMAGIDERVSIEEFLILVKTHAAAVWDYLNETQT